MKWIMLIGITLLACGCCCTTGAVVEYQQVSVPVVEPVILDVDDPEPVDVTTTTIDFY